MSARGVARGAWRIGPVLAAMLACGEERRPEVAAVSEQAKTEAAAIAEAAAEVRRKQELAHRIVFADRITFGYMLLLPGPPGPAPTRAEVQAIVGRAFAGEKDDAEVELLLAFVATPPAEALGVLRAPGAEDEKEGVEGPAEPGAGLVAPLPADLLGVEIVEMRRADAIEGEALADPELTRALTPEERASLPGRERVLLVRALYRNQNGVRGLRLLQALVRALAGELGGLVHDPDTLETMGPGAFAARRLQTSRGNIADQVVVLPFPDPRSGAGAVRLATRGMRRFGSVDLELDGLAVDMAGLQQATYFLQGLAAVMVRLGEFDRSGFSVEAPEEIELHYADCVAAYGGGARLPRCADCPEQATVHLVERPAEPQDAFGHVVARVVAPRAVGERPGHDHRAWVRKVLDQVLGRPPA